MARLAMSTLIPNVLLILMLFHLSTAVFDSEEDIADVTKQIFLFSEMNDALIHQELIVVHDLDMINDDPQNHHPHAPNSRIMSSPYEILLRKRDPSRKLVKPFLDFIIDFAGTPVSFTIIVIILIPIFIVKVMKLFKEYFRPHVLSTEDEYFPFIPLTVLQQTHAERSVKRDSRNSLIWLGTKFLIRLGDPEIDLSDIYINDQEEEALDPWKVVRAVASLNILYANAHKAKLEEEMKLAAKTEIDYDADVEDEEDGKPMVEVEASEMGDEVPPEIQVKLEKKKKRLNKLLTTKSIRKLKFSSSSVTNIK